MYSLHIQVQRLCMYGCAGGGLVVAGRANLRDAGASLSLPLAPSPPLSLPSYPPPPLSIFSLPPSIYLSHSLTHSLTLTRVRACGPDVRVWAGCVRVSRVLAQVGSPPFYSDNTKAAYQRLLTEPVEFPDAVASSAARDFIRALLPVPPPSPLFPTSPTRRLVAAPPRASESSTRKPCTGPCVRRDSLDSAPRPASV
jgi:hypothetical protein